MIKKLSDEALAQELQDVSNWTYKSDQRAIVREWQFESFSQAFAFMTRVAFEAEKAGHHPDWSNSYDKVKISLSTHDAGGLSHKDIELAKKIDALAG